MSDDESKQGQTYGRAGAYNAEPGKSVGTFDEDGQAGGVGSESGGYTGQTGTGYGHTLGGGASPEDAALREQVAARLETDPFLDATQIRVEVIGGRASLSGEVTARADKRRAEDLAKAVDGVIGVDDDLKVVDASTG